MQRYYVLTVGREGLQTGRGYPMVPYALETGNAPACSCAHVLVLCSCSREGFPGGPGGLHLRLQDALRSFLSAHPEDLRTPSPPSRSARTWPLQFSGPELSPLLLKAT